MGEATLDDAIQMVKAALAEAGHPDIDVWRDPVSHMVTLERRAPLDVGWRAGALVAPVIGARMPCWPCYRDAYGFANRALENCEHDTWDGAPPVVRPVEAQR